MSNYRRNVLVGVTVLASMVMLGWMILRFGGSLGAPFAGKTMPVRFVTERADGLSEGSAILFRGVTVGRVTLVQRATECPVGRGLVAQLRDAVAQDRMVDDGQLGGHRATISPWTTPEPRKAPVGTGAFRSGV